MATVRIVPKEHWDILREYFDDKTGVVLVREDVLNDLTDEQQAFLKEHDGGEIDYNFDGDADLWVDCVTTPNHCFLSCVLPYPDEL